MAHLGQFDLGQFDLGEFDLGQFCVSTFFLDDLGQFDSIRLRPIGPNRRVCVCCVCCVCLLCVSAVCVCCVCLLCVSAVWFAWSPGAPPPYCPSAGPPLRRTAQNFALFFPSPTSIFHSSLWGSSRGILVVFWSVGTSNVLVFALRLSCETPAPSAPFGVPPFRGPTLPGPYLFYVWTPTLRGPKFGAPPLLPRLA